MVEILAGIIVFFILAPIVLFILGLLLAGGIYGAEETLKELGLMERRKDPKNWTQEDTLGYLHTDKWPVVEKKKSWITFTVTKPEAKTKSNEN